MISDPEELTEVSIKALASMIRPGLEVDPILVARLAGTIVGVLLGNAWDTAVLHGLTRAEKLKSVADADKAARERL